MISNKYAGVALLPLVLGLLAGCGGDGGGGTPATSTLGGVAAVGSPIVNGLVSVSCAAGNALTATTDSAGAWQVTLSGQTFPCAVQVNGGNIGTAAGAANATPYHSIATASGTVNITPLTDMMVASLAGVSVPGVWFSGLNSAALTAITQTQVDDALARLRTALSGLSGLGTINPVTTVFTPTPGNASDDMLAALATAMTSSGITYSGLLGSASAITFVVPAGFNTALAAAYSGVSSGSGSSGSGTTTGGSGNYTLTVSVSANGVSASGITLNNVLKPADEAAFCGDASVQSALSSAASGGSLAINSCTFNGTTGSISATLSITSPIAMTVPYTVNYSYAASSGSGGSGTVGASCAGTLLTFSDNASNSLALYTQGQEVCFTASATALSFSGKTLTDPVVNGVLSSPYSGYTFTDSAAGVKYEVIFNAGVLYEININIIGGIDSTGFVGQFQ